MQTALHQVSYFNHRRSTAKTRARQSDNDHLDDMVLYDRLTNLPNRVLLVKRLSQILRQIPHGRALALLYLDVERFAHINAALGYRCGDLLLKAVAERLQGCTRETDMVARIGNDEFAIFRLSADPVREGAALARQVLAAVGEPVFLGTRHLLVNAGIGIAISPTHASDAEQLLRCAEIALSRLRSDGSEGYCFFQQEMAVRARTCHELEGDLREAVRTGDLHLHFQPVFDLERNKIAACEALLRWTHHRRGAIPPASFISLAESSGLILPMGKWALREACAQAATWREDIGVAVNLSAAQVSPVLVQTVAETLDATGLAPGRVELEVTETLLLKRTNETLATLEDLRALGVKIAIDDFGTGYSSLLYLRNFPFDKIKIDRSFVSCVSQRDKRSVAVLRAAVALGMSLEMATTAEGVETEEQLEIVREAGCTQAQGFLLGRPKAAAEIRSLLEGPAALEASPPQVEARLSVRETLARSCRTPAA